MSKFVHNILSMRIRYLYFLPVLVLGLSATAQQSDSVMIKKIADEI